MIDLRDARLARVQRQTLDRGTAIVAALLFGVLAGVMIGIGLSLIWLVSVATRPRMPVLARERGTQVFRELDEHPQDEQFPGVVVMGLDGGLFFATSDALEDRLREVATSTPGLTGIVLDCEGIDFIDSQGSAKMREILELTNQAGVTLRLARLKPAVGTCSAVTRVLERIGADRIGCNVDHAVEAQIAEASRNQADPRCRSHYQWGERKERVMLRAVRRIGVLLVATGTGGPAHRPAGRGEGPAIPVHITVSVSGPGLAAPVLLRWGGNTSSQALRIVRGTSSTLTRS
jgi:anti-anti-sigma factor